MADSPASPDQQEGYLEEIEEGFVLDNLHLLELKFIGQPRQDLDKQTELSLYAIKDRGVRSWEGKIEHAISIGYETRTGRIGFGPDNANMGELSRLNTDLIESQEGSETKKQILLHRLGTMPSADQYASAITGEQVGLDMGNRRIQPERVIPDHSNLQGVTEVWGESQFVDSARGDLVMLKTIRKFNELHGPSR